MRTITPFILILVLVLSSLSCSAPNDTIPNGAYTYNAYDSLNAKVSMGWFTLVVDSDSTFSGEWHLSNVGVARSDIGPQIGEGTLRGGQSGDHISINMNPEWVDNNVFLIGTKTGETITGKWQYSSFAGIQNSGDFVAVLHN